ncbi:MAG: CDP-diacylglycerol--serine O-phosphatidyltransferase [Methanobacteriaceae archaeon]|nr:CDP-diacylglycerol--serine O-phosphatidyltransferase [Methanobacteriaceae archaeon]
MTSIADIVSLANALSGILAIITAISGQYQLTAKLLIFAVIFDSLDGIVARKTKKDNQDCIFGENIDSLSDVTSFAIAPAIIITQLINSPYVIWVSLLIVSTGILRLTRYNVISSNQKGPTKTFIGLPIPSTAIILSTIIILSLQSNQALVLCLMIIISILMISNIKYPKITNLKSIMIPALLAIILLLPTSINNLILNIPAIILLLLTVIYIFIYPIKQLLISEK